MKPIDLDPSQRLAMLSALATVARADGALAPQERRYLELHGELFGLDAAPEALPEISPEALAASITDPEQRAALVQRLVVLTMIDAEVHDAELGLTRAYARALDVAEPALCHMQAFARGRMRWLAFDFGRRSFIGKRIKQVWRDAGVFRGAVEVFKAARGVPDPALAARYAALAELPPGTLGRELHAHYQRNDFEPPGEKGGTPRFLVFHDLGHVLTDHPTDPAGEVQMAGFEAGYMGEDGFSVTVLALFAFHLAAPIIPTNTAHGMFDLDAYQRAFNLGQTLNADLREWDAWPFMDWPVAKVRAHLGLS